MENLFMEKLYAYLIDNNPDILVALQLDGKLTSYLEDKVSSIDGVLTELTAKGQHPYIIEEICLQQMTADLRPSKYYYLRLVLEEEFEEQFLRLSKAGILTYEVINLLQVCTPIFENYHFSEQTEQDRHLRYEIMGAIDEYFESV